MEKLKKYIDMEIELEISGKTVFYGILMDIGPDILVLFDGRNYLYIPLLHVHNIKERIEKELTGVQPPVAIGFENDDHEISYRKTLSNAKGQFLEIFVTGNKSLHGYITSVLNDYIVFYSPVYKNVFISMHHLKWLTPYSYETTPYSLSSKELPVVPLNIPLARSFEEQLKKYKESLMVFDLGEEPDKIGLLKNVENNTVELAAADSRTVFWKLSHLKMFHLP
ncbi:DUF2642 domain-containing protein [Bacillus smithii]|uniref:DUF2642 domain-containing protein n=1 Tax=Bacillus smithii TaxID=1479 RepID=UPI002E1C2CFB|nr:DUF2642 domain-containing protein [Bacillus smithii]